MIAGPPAPVRVMAAAAVTPLGPPEAWREGATNGLLAAVLSDAASVDPQTALQVPPLAPLPGRKLDPWMSPAARLAVAVTGELLADLSPARAHAMGLFVAAGASGDLGEALHAVVGASCDAHGYRDETFVRRGIKSIHPRKTFELLSNFTMCHAAIAHQVRGPNAVFYSRGAGTVQALYEAAWAVADGRCDEALAVAADTGDSALTRDELARDGWLAEGLVPGLGAAGLRLAAGPLGDDEIGLDGLGMADGLPDLSTDWIIAQTARDEPVLGGLRVPVCHLRSIIGEPLAAGPAIGWAVAWALLRAGRAARVAVVGRSLDEQWTWATFRRGPA